MGGGGSTPTPPPNPYPSPPTTGYWSTYSYLPQSGTIRMSDLRYVLEGTYPVSMSDYRATSRAGFSKGISGITDTNLSLSKFYGKSSPVYYSYNALQYLEYTQVYNAIAFNWTAPLDCCIQSIQFYVGNGNNGTNISIWTNTGTTFLNGFWPFKPYGVIQITPNFIEYGNTTWDDSVFSARLRNARITAGTVLTVYISALSGSNYFFYGRNGHTNSPSFAIEYVAFR